MRMVDHEGLGIGDNFSGYVNCEHLTLGVFTEFAENRGQICVVEEHVQEIRIELLLLHCVPK